MCSTSCRHTHPHAIYALSRDDYHNNGSVYRANSSKVKRCRKASLTLSGLGRRGLVMSACSARSPFASDGAPTSIVRAECTGIEYSTYSKQRLSCIKDRKDGTEIC
eukprot:290016-Pleurochrysis_carterae.AAC.10